MFVWGALGATLLSLIGNGIVDGLLSPEVSVVYGAAISAPLVEEMSKGLALLVGFFIAKLVARRFHSIEFGGKAGRISQNGTVTVLYVEEGESPQKSERSL